MPRPKLISVTEAIELAKEYHIQLSRPTVIKHAMKFKYGHQIGGRGGKWVVNKDKFMRFLRGSNDVSKNKISGGSSGGSEQKNEEQPTNYSNGSESDTHTLHPV